MHFFFFFLTQSLSLGNVNPFMEHVQYVEHKGSNVLTEKTSLPPVIAVPQNMIHTKHSVFLRDITDGKWEVWLIEIQF